MRFPEARRGQPITAEHVQAIYQAIRELELDVVPPLVKVGNLISVQDGPGWFIKITGAPSGAKYPWTQQFAQTGGSWIDGAASGTTSVDPAYELNGSTASLTGKIVKAWRDRASNEVRFHFSAC